MVQQFLDDGSQPTLTLPKSVTSAERDTVRQICKHFDVPFKVHGEGTEKFMVLRRPDYSYFDEAEAAQSALLSDKAEVERLRKLVLQLSNDVNVARIKANLMKHQMTTEAERETAEAAVEVLIQSRTGCCSICCERVATRMSTDCGHSCCAECFDIVECPLCEHPVGPVTELSPEPVKDEPVDDAVVSPKSKKART